MAAKTAVLNRVLRARARWPWTCLNMIVGLLLGVQLACSSDSTAPNRQATSQTYWALRLNAHAVNMALTSPANVVQLHAAALAVTGNPLTEVGQIVYSTGDSLVSVDSTGRITAHYATNGAPTQVIATLTVQGVTLADTAQVQIDATARSLASFSIHPVPGDSAKCAVDSGYCLLPVLAVDSQGDTLHSADIDSILVNVTSSNPYQVQADQSGHVSPQGAITNDVVITASTLAYGVPWRDSVRYTVGYSIFTNVNVNNVYQVGSPTPVNEFIPLTITVGVGAIVGWSSQSTTPVDVAFVDSTSVQGISSADSARSCQLYGRCFIHISQGGNIKSIPAAINGENSDGEQWRRFPVAGTYPYHSSLLGIHGNIVVSAGP